MSFKILKTTLLSIPLIFLSNQSFAGGAQSANIARIQSYIGMGASAAYAASNFSKCSPKSPHYCREGLKGIMQALSMLNSAKNSGYTAAKLSGFNPDSFAFDPSDAGFCFDPSTGCTPNDIDGALDGFQDAFQTGDGYDAAADAFKDKLLKDLDKLKQMGYDPDIENGTLTDPNGNKVSVAASDTNMPQSLLDAAASRASGVESALGGGDGSDRALASEKTGNGGSGSGAGGGLSGKGKFDSDGFGLDSKGLGLNHKNSKKKKRKDFLAGLSDDDASKKGVGFAGDDIFNMIQRRYSKKVSAKEFISKK
jgi:hypothetical protein